MNDPRNAAATKVMPDEEPRRILICCYSFEIGGFSSHAINFGGEFRRMGYHVSALVTEPFGDLYGEFVRSLNNVTIVRRGLESRNAHLRRMIKVITELRPDIVINNVVPFVQAAFPYLPARTTRISAVHGIWEGKAEHEIDIALSNAAFVDAVVGVSENIRAVLVRRAPHGMRIQTIPEAVAEATTPVARAGAARPLRLIFVGRLTHQKNLPALLQIAQQLREAGMPFVLTMIGSGVEAEDFRRSITQAGLNTEVKMLGALPPGEIGKALGQHDFFLMTSFYEGTPFVLLEAMTHGLVALASRLPGSTDRIITHGVDGFLCDANNPADYVAHLRRLQSNAEEFSRVSAAARRTVTRQFSVGRLAREYEPIFEPAGGPRNVPVEVAQCEVASSLIPFTVGFPRQVRHRLADIWKSLAHDRHHVTIR